MRRPLTATTWGFCYLLHFSQPLGNPTNVRAQAQHYIGFAADDGSGAGLEHRIAEHLAGDGARITRAALANGIAVELVAAWRGPLALEKRLKARKEAPRLCPVCAHAAGRRVKRVEPMVEQLTLGLDLVEMATEAWIEPADMPAVSNKMDWLEITYLRRWAALRTPLPIDIPDEI
jgi:putative endonuclease